MLKYIKDSHVIYATEKAYEVLYKTKGYIPYEKIKDLAEKEEGKHLINYQEMKVEELRELAKEKEIEGYSKMKKEELINSLTE